MITMKESEILSEMFEDKYRELKQESMRLIRTNDYTQESNEKLDETEKRYNTLNLLKDKFINMGMLSK